MSARFFQFEEAEKFSPMMRFVEVCYVQGPNVTTMEWSNKEIQGV
jgi:hypothetical protein